MILLLYFYLVAPITAIWAIVFFSRKKLRPIVIATVSVILLSSIAYLPLRYNKVFIHKLEHNGRNITSSNQTIDLVFLFPRTVERGVRFYSKFRLIELSFLSALYFTSMLIVVEMIGYVKRHLE